MRKKIKHFLEGVGSTIDLWPSEVQGVSVKDPEERLRRPWERTGRLLEQALDKVKREPTSR